MTVEEAIKKLKNLEKSRDFKHYLSTESPTCFSALSMAISALEKEKEPALQEAKTSSNNNYSIKDDNTKLKECQEVIDLVVTELIEYYRDQLSREEQKAWELGEVCRKVLDAQNLLEEEKQ